MGTSYVVLKYDLYSYMNIKVVFIYVLAEWSHTASVVVHLGIV